MFDWLFKKRARPTPLWMWECNDPWPLTFHDWVKQMRPSWLRMLTRPNPLLQHLNEAKFDSQFGHAGAKIGSTLRIRLPQDYQITATTNGRRSNVFRRLAIR